MVKTVPHPAQWASRGTDQSTEDTQASHVWSRRRGSPARPHASIPTRWFSHDLRQDRFKGFRQRVFDVLNLRYRSIPRLSRAVPSMVSNAIAKALISSSRSRRSGSATRSSAIPIPKHKSLSSVKLGSIAQREEYCLTNEADPSDRRVTDPPTTSERQVLWPPESSDICTLTRNPYGPHVRLVRLHVSTGVYYYIFKLDIDIRKCKSSNKGHRTRLAHLPSGGKRDA